MDGPSRARIVLGTVAVLVAALASLALLNVLLEEPLPVGGGKGDGGGEPGGPGPVFQPPDGNASQGDGGQAPRKTNPCDTAEPAVRGAALATTVIAMGLWVLAVWWRQRRQTRVMNGWAIGALLVTLVATTLMFAWWIVHKVCSLDVFNLKSCMEIAHSLRNAFFFFLLAAVGLLGYALARARSGHRFWGLWSIAGSIFVYLSVLGLIGWVVAEDMCEKQFHQPDDLPDPPNQPNQPDEPGDPGTGNNGGSPGGGLGGGQRGGGGGGGGGAAPALPQVSPFALLVLLGIAAVITIIVLAVKGRQDQQRAAAMAALGMDGMAGMLRLFMDTDVESSDAVVAAYRRFLDHCMLHGVPKHQSETPREHGRRAAGHLGLPYEGMLPLLDAYAHIRLAHGPLPEERRQAALSLRLWRPRAKARRVRKTGGRP